MAYKLKLYKFWYITENGDVLQTKINDFYNIADARKYASHLLADSMSSDLFKINVTFFKTTR